MRAAIAAPPTTNAAALNRAQRRRLRSLKGTQHAMPIRTQTVALVDPLKHGDEVVHELTFTTPNIGQMLELDKATGDVAKFIVTMTLTTGLPPSVVKQMLPPDFKTCAEAVAFVMGESEGTGAT